MPRPRILITSGPTQEPIDEVRFIGNRSSGRMGLALAYAARRLSLKTTLLLGPLESTDLPDYSRFNPTRFRTAADLQLLLAAQWPHHDILLMAAAVADFRPVVTKTSKIRRAEAPFALSLEPVPDLLAECAAAARPNQLLVGFALEPAADLLARASQKLTGKGIDLIVGNPLETMGSRMIEATLVAAEQSKLPLTRMPAQSKEAFADELLRHCMLLWETKLNRLM